VIGWVAKALGLNTLIVWALVALLGVGSVWGYGAIKHRAGVNEGRAAEAAIWSQHMADLRAKNEAEKRTAQAKIDDIEKKYFEQRQLAEALDAELEVLIHELETGDDAGKPAVSRRLSNVLNKTGR
jgi:outer membrane lipopolysaccharide assembly protein LptE/RlpB